MRDRIATRYELREKLGSSATATVWRARDRRRRRDVALKVANDQPADVLSRRQLAAEADAAARLDHPNIVPLLDAHLGRRESALAFGYVGGETLSRRLANGARLSPYEAASIAADLASALAHAHSRGVIHRDVKPGNVLIDKNGRARLFDFGISATPDRATGALVEPGMTTGTLPYMAPEQLVGQPAEPATDVYSLGAVLYEMLAGHRPYGATSPEQLVIQQQRPPAPVPDAPPALIELAATALSADPAARPTATAFARRLRAWLAGTADADTVAVATVPQTSSVPLVAPLAAFGHPAPAARRPSGIAMVATALVVIAVLAGALALAAGFTRAPGATAPPASFVVPSPSVSLTAPPAVQNGGGGGGNHGNGHGGGNGHGKGP